MTTRDAEDIALVDSNVTLPNGVVVANRLVKAAMAEGVSHRGSLPGPEHRRLYKAWAAGGWGIIVTGNVQVDPRQLASPEDCSIPDDSPDTIAAYASLNQAILSGAKGGAKPLTLLQLSHPGLQASWLISLARPPWTSAVGPVSARPDLGDSLLGTVAAWIAWPAKSERLGTDEWLEVVQLFVRGSKVTEQAGWGGVQIHSAHGYLLAEYLSPLTNPSPEPLKGVPSELPLRLHLLFLILHGVRQATSSQFVLSVKINCSDFVKGGLDEEEAADIIKRIVSWGVVDILEVSGGTYTSPAFASPETISRPQSSTTRQSLFAHFTTALTPHLPQPPEGPAILLTGGLHDRSLISTSLRDRACDFVGIGRPACIDPDLPKSIILNKAFPNEETNLGGYKIRGLIIGRVVSGLGIPLVGAGVSTLWHEMQLNRLGRGLKPDLALHFWWGFLVEFVWWGIFRGGPFNWS